MKNGQTKVDPARDVIYVNGNRLPKKLPPKVYLALNKPKGFVFFGLSSSLLNFGLTSICILKSRTLTSLQVHMLIRGERHKISYIAFWWLFEELGMSKTYPGNRLAMCIWVVKVFLSISYLWCSSRTKEMRDNQNHGCLLLAALMLPQVGWLL